MLFIIFHILFHQACGLEGDWWYGDYVKFPYNNVLRSGQILNGGEGLVSISGNYVALMKDDCNFIVHRTSQGAKSGSIVFSTETSGHGDDCQFVFNPNSHDGSIFPGELYIRKESNNANYWESTNGPDPTWDGYSSTANRLVMQDDGNLVAYSNDGSPYWATNTYETATTSNFFSNSELWKDYIYFITGLVALILLCNVVFIFKFCRMRRKITYKTVSSDNENDELI